MWSSSSVWVSRLKEPKTWHNAQMNTDSYDNMFCGVCFTFVEHYFKVCHLKNM